MGYIYILIASLAVGGQFSLSKVYKRLTPDSGYTDLFYNFAMGVFSVVLFAVVCLGKVGVNTFSFALAGAVAVANTIYSLCGLKAVMYGKLSVFTTFLMLGGMIFPTFYGIWFLREKMSVFKIAGLALLILSMLFSLTEKTEEKKSRFLFYLLCLIAFVCNGFFKNASDKRASSEYFSIFFLAIRRYCRYYGRSACDISTLSEQEKEFFLKCKTNVEYKKFKLDFVSYARHACGKRDDAAGGKKRARLAAISDHHGSFYFCDCPFRQSMF